ncbi:MAG: dihydropteroate synthase [Anaerolineae bacterium]|nr:dihydropteroate synthase [Anaerolineae bacterium]MCB0200112.1 dihydropteroate synthase [Anaerolineae bacterium]MCB0204314.1 dihydropteroate synthase [Anaerolineae bacterium]
METILESPTKTVIIGPGRPFVIIGERINPTGRKKLAAEMAAGDFSRVIADAKAQVEAGAHVLDVNSGVPLTDEAELMTEAIRLVQQTVDAPISIDSSVVSALKAGLKAATGKPLVNSVTGEDERLEAILPLVAERGAAVIGISNDETGISYDPRERFKIAKKIVERAESYGIPRSDVLIDPLAMPVGAVQGAGKHLFDIVRMVREELGCNTICGASNISFGLPNRPILNATFVAMAIAAGMPCAITNPLDQEIKQAILAADVMMGTDENCAAWITAQRQAASAAAPEESSDETATSARASRRAERAARRQAREQ